MSTDFFNRHKKIITAIGVGLLIIVIILFIVLVLSHSSITAPSFDSPNNPPSNNAGTETNMPTGLIPPQNVAPNDQAAWAPYEAALEAIALSVIREHYTGHTITNAQIFWHESRTNVANGANPAFNLVALIDGDGISINFKLTRSGDTYILLSNSITRGMAPF
jgi:hypothetical protein